jgi:hypothetical protein
VFSRERRIPRSLTLAELVESYLAQHQEVTIKKLRWPKAEPWRRPAPPAILCSSQTLPRGLR